MFFFLKIYALHVKFNIKLSNIMNVISDIYIISEQFSKILEHGIFTNISEIHTNTHTYTQTLHFNLYFK